MNNWNQQKRSTNCSFFVKPYRVDTSDSCIFVGNLSIRCNRAHSIASCVHFILIPHLPNWFHEKQLNKTELLYYSLKQVSSSEKRIKSHWFFQDNFKQKKRGFLLALTFQTIILTKTMFNNVRGCKAIWNLNVIHSW